MEALLAQLQHYGVALVGVNVLLQQLGLPIPAVPTMVIAGALAAEGRMNGLGVFAISVAASVVADALWYFAGRKYGYSVLKFLCKVSLSPDTCVRQTEGIFERYGFFSLVVSKFVPGFSTVAPPVAGALKMGFGSFLAATFASAALWVGAAMGFGLAFHAQIGSALEWMGRNAATAGLVVLVALALYIAYKAFERWRLSRIVLGRRITVEELRGKLDAGDPLHLVDVGGKIAHQSRPHIPGAIPMTLDDISRSAALFPNDREIVFYCACPNEESARRAAQILLRKGFTQVRPLVGGIDAWVEAGHPVHGGEQGFEGELATSRR